MGKFFKYRRRNAGLATLVMACLFMAWWMRSLAVADIATLIVPSLGAAFSVHSHSGTTELYLMRGEPSVSLHWWFSSPIVNYHNLVLSERTHLRLRGCGDANYVMAVPHWWTVLLLTVLSGWLLLSKPRSRSPQKTNPTSEDLMNERPESNSNIRIGIAISLVGLALMNLYSVAFGLATSFIFGMKSEFVTLVEYWVSAFAGYGTAGYLLRHVWHRAVATSPDPDPNLDLTQNDISAPMTILKRTNKKE